MVLYFIYAAIEYHVAADQQELRLLVHGFVIPCALVGVALLSYRPSLSPFMVSLLTTASVAAVCANLYFNVGSGDFAYYLPEIYLNLMWVFAVSGLTSRQAMPTACTSLLILLAVTIGNAAQPGLHALHWLWILASFSFGLLCALLLETANKSIFLQKRRLAVMATIDSLTGLWSRSRIDEILADEIARTSRYGGSLSVIIVDIDHFKLVNDTHGHAAGDQVLRQFAAILQSNVRGTDRVGRRGGEEFLMVLPGTNRDSALTAALLLQKSINAFTFDYIGHNTASFGVTEYCSRESGEALLERGDRALYKAKANGRDRIQVSMREQGGVDWHS